MMMAEWRKLWYEGTNGATDPDFPIGFVQIGPLGQIRGPESTESENTFAVRIGQTGGMEHGGTAPNTRWPHTFMSTGYDLMNPP
jgi:sialate O-acetylesterase